MSLDAPDASASDVPLQSAFGSVGPYDLHGILGRGGFAVVWLARKKGASEYVALKTIRPEFASDGKVREMLLHEARIVARIAHPNVTHLVEYGRVDNIVFLALEYVPGESLSALVRGARDRELEIPVEVVGKVVCDVCSGLHAAHELREGEAPLGVVHRDVSPQNILISPKGEVKLVDFGIAKARLLRPDDTTAGVAKGKPRYMPPEQMLGEAVDRRSDVWSLGAIAYELLEGHPAHDGPNEISRLHSLVHREGPPPMSDSVPPAIAEVICRALARDPAKRFATAAEFGRAFEDAMSASSIHADGSAVAAFLRATTEGGSRRVLRPEAADLPLATATIVSAPRLPIDDPSPSSRSMSERIAGTATSTTITEAPLPSPPPRLGRVLAGLGALLVAAVFAAVGTLAITGTRSPATESAVASSVTSSTLATPAASSETPNPALTLAELAEKDAGSESRPSGEGAKARPAASTVNQAARSKSPGGPAQARPAHGASPRGRARPGRESMDDTIQ